MKKGLEHGYAFFSPGCLEIERNRRDFEGAESISLS